MGRVSSSDRNDRTKVDVRGPRRELILGNHQGECKGFLMKRPPSRAGDGEKKGKVEKQPARERKGKGKEVKGDPAAGVEERALQESSTICRKAGSLGKR